MVEARPLDQPTEAALEADSRAGAKAILEAVRRRRFENRSEGQRLRKLLRYENALWSTGVLLVAGVDEAGMSPLAGPVAAAAVIFKPGSRIPGVDDSKKLDAASRDVLAAEIKQTATAWSVGFAEVAEIDTINIYWAGLLAMRRAVEGLSRSPQHVLVDARRIKDLPIPQQPIVKGDCKSLTIAAASILAKTARDALMHQAGRAASRLRLCEAQGLPCGRAPCRAQAAWSFTDPPAVIWARPPHPRPASASAMAQARECSRSGSRKIEVDPLSP